MIDENAAPRPRTDVDLASLSPSAEQYFLLSRLDGKLTVAELCKISGLGREKTLEVLLLLAQAGAIEVPGYQPEASISKPEPAPEPTPEPAPASIAAESPSRGSAADATSRAPATQSDRSAKSAKKKASGDRVMPNFPVPPAAFDFDAALLAVDAPIDDELRRELICLHAQLEQMSFYDLFGLEPGAGRKEIKKAYFRLSKRYHPDKFFRQDLGPLRAILETVFKEITRAYKTLSKKRARNEYDQALQAHQSALSQQADAGQQEAEAEAEDAEIRERNKRKAVSALLMRRAEKLMAREDFSRAAGEFRKALALSRDPHVAMEVASRLLQDADMPEEAASFARAAIKLGADEASAYFLVGRALEAQGAVGAAVTEYRRVLAGVPKHAGALARLGALGEKL